MTLGAMQPYFFPYLGYFELIKRADTWVVFDVVKYVRKGWMNRNRVLHPTQGWQYITVPVHAGDDELIKDVRVVDLSAAHNRVMGQLMHYRKARAPYFSKVMRLVDETFRSAPTDLLVDLNVTGLRLVCEYLGFVFDPIILSRSEIKLPEIDHAGQWSLELATALKQDRYLNPPGAKYIFRAEEFEARKIALEFTELCDFRYSTKPYQFVDRLSILDVLMWNAPTNVTHYVEARS